MSKSQPIPTLAARLKQQDNERVENLIGKEMRSNSAVMRRLLERFVDGSLVPYDSDKEKVSTQITVQVTEEFKNEVDTKRKALGITTTELVLRLLNAYEAEQGEAK
jgi:hypothetical protein